MVLVRLRGRVPIFRTVDERRSGKIWRYVALNDNGGIGFYEWNGCNPGGQVT